MCTRSGTQTQMCITFIILHTKKWNKLYGSVFTPFVQWLNSIHIFFCKLAASTNMASFLGHAVLIACIGVQCQDNTNKWLYNAAHPDPLISGQWQTQMHTFQTKVKAPPPPNNYKNQNQDRSPGRYLAVVLRHWAGSWKRQGQHIALDPTETFWVYSWDHWTSLSICTIHSMDNSSPQSHIMKQSSSSTQVVNHSIHITILTFIETAASNTNWT